MEKIPKEYIDTLMQISFLCKEMWGCPQCPFYDEFSYTQCYLSQSPKSWSIDEFDYLNEER